MSGAPGENPESGGTASGIDGPPEVVALLPVLLSVWDDGVLSDGEVRALRAALSDAPWLDDDATAALAEWLDPDRPPTPQRLASLRRYVRNATPGPDAETSLAALGRALWRETGADGPWNDPQPRAWLEGVEAALGLVGSEAAKRQLGRPSCPTRSVSDAPSLDVEALHAHLDRHRRAIRRDVLALLTTPGLQVDDTRSGDEQRERVLEVVRHLADLGYGRLAYPDEVGGGGDPGAAVAVFETLGFGNLSVLVKFGVQFGLFGGSVLQLGSPRHHRAWLPDIGSLALPGCYAMTETGHGSNVRDLETVATYEHPTRELVVRTPHEEAGKDWIGNAAAHGRMATVFARLVVDGDDHGVHALLVPIRDAEGRFAPGVRIEDRGLKLGLNGVDNGRIWFDDVRVPVDHLLDRFASIDEDGRYHSPIPSPGRRFFTMLGTLVSGRVSVASASVSAAKTGLTIAVRYAATRRQFGPDGGPEHPILDYLAMQRSLLPRLATTYGLHFAVRDLQRRFESGDGTPDPRIEADAAGLKAYASDHCVETLQACREACGGRGYLHANRFAALKADTDVFTTFEGANFVLYQLVAKGLLSRYQEEVGDLTPWRIVKYLGERAETRLTELNPIATRRTDLAHLTDPEFHLGAMVYREERLLRSAALRLRARLRDGVDSFDAVDQVQDHLIALARAHVERRILESFQLGCAQAPTPGLSETLAELCTLYALSRIEADRGWFLETGYMEGGKARAIRAGVNRLCRELAGSAEAFVGGFGIPDALLPAIGRRDGR